MLQFLFNLCVITLSLGQFSVLSEFGSGKIYLFDLCIALFCLIGVLYFLIVNRKFLLPKGSIYFGLFTLVAVMSLSAVVYKYSPDEILVSMSYLFRWMTYFGAGLVVFNMVSQDLMSREKVLSIFVLSAVFISLVGFIQMVILPNFETLDPSLGWDPHKNRLTSTFFDPNFTGAYLVLCLTILIEKFFVHRSVSKLSGREIAFGIIILTAILLTFSRSAWLMLGVVILVYGLLRSRMLLFSALVFMFLAYYAVPRIQTRITGVTDPADSAHFRLISWKNTFEIAKDNLLLGVGFNTFRYVQKEYGFLDVDTFSDHAGAGSDSSLLFVLATTGVFGFGFYLLGFVYSVVRSVVEKNTNWVFVLALFSGLIVESQFINSLFYPQIMFVWLVVVPSSLITFFPVFHE